MDHVSFYLINKQIIHFDQIFFFKSGSWPKGKYHHF